MFSGAKHTVCPTLTSIVLGENAKFTVVTVTSHTWPRQLRGWSTVAASSTLSVCRTFIATKPRSVSARKHEVYQFHPRPWRRFCVDPVRAVCTDSWYHTDVAKHRKRECLLMENVVITVYSRGQTAAVVVSTARHLQDLEHAR
jgi:hypothetical protein